MIFHGDDFMNKMLTVEQTSALLNVHGETVRGWLRSGKLRGVKMGPRSWRVPESALRELTGESATDSGMKAENTSAKVRPTMDDFFAKVSAFHREMEKKGISFEGVDGAELVRAGREERTRQLSRSPDEESL